MPSSAIESVPYLIEFIRKNKPDLQSVLDVGVGFGKDGFLLREYFDVKKDHLYQPKSWKLQITGVEIFKDYITDLQKMIYSNIVIGDIFDVLPTLKTFDLAVLADIIEHFPKEKGYELLEELFDHVQDIVITTPHGFLENHFHENPYEQHKSAWELEDFKSFTIIDHTVIKRIRKPEELLVVYLRK